MIILDTNVVSELMRPKPEPRVIAWLNLQPRTSVWITSITVFEVHFGLQTMPRRKRRDAYAQGFEDLTERIGGRIAPFDSEAAEQAGALMSARQAQGRPRDFRDTMLAGIVLSRHARLATRNVRDFEDIAGALIDPWNA